MRLLLDTNTILFDSQNELPKEATKLLDDAHNQLFFSSVSIWELVIKKGTHRDNFKPDPFTIYTGLLDDGFIELPITTPQILKVGVLPQIHKDPYDRLLIAQAITENMTILTADARIAEYPGVSVIHFQIQ
jgi:PIN domain nuclease of toxin-antitoxin system